MGLFSKAEYVEAVLPFIYDSNSIDVEACTISIEAYGYIIDQHKYCYASFEVSAKDYDELAEILMTAETKLVKVNVKVKNGVAKSFKMDLDDLAERYHDDRLKKLGLLAWDLRDKSFREFESQA